MSRSNRPINRSRRHVVTAPYHETFAHYAAHRPKTDDPAGDFIEDFWRPRREFAPLSIKSWDDLEGYLLVMSACPAAIEAARTVWAEYEEKTT